MSSLVALTTVIALLMGWMEIGLMGWMLAWVCLGLLQWVSASNGLDWVGLTAKPSWDGLRRVGSINDGSRTQRR